MGSLGGVAWRILSIYYTGGSMNEYTEPSWFTNEDDYYERFEKKKQDNKDPDNPEYYTED